MSKNKSMGVLFSSLFWGIIIVLIGLSIILREFFDVHIPVFRLVVGVFFIYIGFKIVFRAVRGNKNNDVVFEERHQMKFDRDKADFNIVFGAGSIDLSNPTIKNTHDDIEINVVFGNALLRINDSIPTKIQMNNAFANTTTPDNQSSSFGSSLYFTSSYRKNEPYVFIKTNTVFGRLNIYNVSNNEEK